MVNISQLRPWKTQRILVFDGFYQNLLFRSYRRSIIDAIFEEQELTRVIALVCVWRNGFAVDKSHFLYSTAE